MHCGSLTDSSIAVSLIYLHHERHETRAHENDSHIEGNGTEFSNCVTDAI